jgi:SAM-dependent methyltransferase
MIGVEEREQTLSSFDWQWAHLASGDFMPGDPWFDRHAATILARELCAIEPAWFRDKSVLDAGCGQGRWSRALLELGARVTAVDFSEAGLARTREVCTEHGRLTTRRVDLLDVPDDLAKERFDLVFSFGVLHHTGNTWLALDNVARLVAPNGALFLYLYGSTSWDTTERDRIERTRRELEPLAFEEKIAELRRRYPGQDPHQLFDLLSPVINDRVSFHDVADRLRRHGFQDVERTIASGEVYVRAIRPDFPQACLTSPVGDASEFARQSAKRWLRRAGAAFEASLRSELVAVARRPAPAAARELLKARGGEGFVDVSLPPDRPELPNGEARWWSEGSPAAPGALAGVRVPLLIALGASAGACRYPRDYLVDLWNAVDRGGTLLLELPDEAAMRTGRSPLDRLRDAKRSVPEKIARLMGRHPTWTTGHALHAIGGSTLLQPIPLGEAFELLRDAGASSVTSHPARPGTVLVIAESGA